MMTASPTQPLPDLRPPYRPSHAMVLAAGLGQRMRPITDTVPKPLIRVGGKAMLDHALDRLAAIGVTDAVVNVHYLASQIKDHLASRTSPRISISDERAELLETGGGLAKARPLLGDRPFLHLNSDSLWIEPGASNLARLSGAWEPSRMDMLLLLADAEASLGYDGAGDFHMAPDGSLTRRAQGERAAHVYAGVAMIEPALLNDVPPGKWSLNLLFDRAIAKGRLYGLALKGEWLHVGTPEAIPLANARFAALNAS